MNDGMLRENLIELLNMGSAHITLDEALRGLATSDAFRRPTSDDGQETHSVWELLEHMRIAQEDIARYTMDPAWTSLEWPTDYWPRLPDEIDDQKERWRVTVEGFEADLEEVRGWVRDDRLDLTAGIPHGEGRTYLRQVLLVANHNAYHLGQIVSVRRRLGLWR